MSPLFHVHFPVILVFPFIFMLCHIYLCFPSGSDCKESACNAGNMGSIPWLGRSPGGMSGNPLQYSCLENRHGQKSLAGYTVHGVTESDTTEWLSTAHIYLHVFSFHWYIFILNRVLLPIFFNVENNQVWKDWYFK